MNQLFAENGKGPENIPALHIFCTAEYIENIVCLCLKNLFCLSAHPFASWYRSRWQNFLRESDEIAKPVFTSHLPIQECRLIVYPG